MQKSDSEASGRNGDDAGGIPAYFKWGAVSLIAVGLIAASFFLPVQAWAQAYRDWLQGLGTAGWIAFLVIYALATAALVPSAILTIAAGLAYGLWGFPLVVLGAVAGAGIAFLASRHLLRDRVQRAMKERPRFRAVDAAINEDGWIVVGLLRLSPAIPFSLQNWVLGVISVEFWPYIMATAVGILPGTLLYVWLGSLGGSAASGETSTARIAFFAAGILATLIITIVVGRKAKAKLNEHGFDGQGAGPVLNLNRPSIVPRFA